MNALAYADPIEVLPKRMLEVVEDTMFDDDEAALARWEDDGGAIGQPPVNCALAVTMRDRVR